MRQTEPTTTLPSDAVPRARDVLTEAAQRGDARGLRVAHAPRAVPAARRELLQDLTGRGVQPEVLTEVAVVVSELVGNAVRHGRALEDGTVLLRWQVRGPVVDVDVTDGGAPAPVRPRRRGALATDGRGLRIVRSLAHEWGTCADAAGRCTVWAALGGATRRRRPA